MNDIQLKKLLKQKITPLYVFDAAKLKSRVRELRQVLPDGIGLCYAVKANAFIVKELSDLADRFEICSPGELRICQELQLPADKFVISGVYKERELMNRLISRNNDVGSYTVESMTQFCMLHDAAQAYKKRIPILLRLTSGNQFGLEAQEIEEIIHTYGASEALDIRGIQYFSGTQKNSLKRLRRELNTVDAFLENLRNTYGYRAKELEFGPGFPVSYFQGESFEEGAFLREFSSMLTGLQFKGRIILELGRSIAASCGSYLTRVVDVKRNHSGNYAIVDGGMHQLVYYGQFMAMKQPYLRVLQSHEGKDQEEWNICGSLCTVNDILVKRIPVKGLEIGDVFVFENTGAYCMTEGISLFLSRDLPEAVLLNEDGSFRTVRESLHTDGFNRPSYDL